MILLAIASRRALFGRALLSASLLIAPATMPAQTAPSVATTPSLQALDSYIEKARTEWNVPGVAVAIVKDDTIVYLKGFGVREAGKPGVVGPDTIFAIGSASKAFTGAALAMLVDEKKIAWDGAVHDYMPAFALNDDYATRNATVRDLLSHRTGFNSGYGWLWTGSGFDRNEIIRRLRFQKNGFGFRNRFAYANEIYTTAGEIVPAVTGTSWDDFVAQRIFQPLGMTRSHTSVSALTGVTDVASPHGMVDDKLVSFPYRQVDNVGGAGAINSTVRDMAQWLRLQLGDGVYRGKRLIGAETIDETHSGQVVARSRIGYPGGQFGEYGFGWIINDYRGHKVVQHSGGVDGMLCVVAMMPGEKLGIVVLTNMLPHQLPTAVALKVFDSYLGGPATDWSATMKAEAHTAKAAADAKAASIAKPPVTPALPLQRYAGSYTSAMYGTATVSVERGALVFSRPTAAAVLLHDGESRFRARWRSDSILSVFGETPVTFATDAAGAISSLDLGPDRFTRDTLPAQPSRR